MKPQDRTTLNDMIMFCSGECAGFGQALEIAIKMRTDLNDDLVQALEDEYERRWGGKSTEEK